MVTIKVCDHRVTGGFRPHICPPALGIYKDVLGLSISIVLAAAAFAVYAWHFWSAHTNKGRAVQILYWIEQFLCGHGHVTGIRWISKSEFEVPLRLMSHVFKGASVRVKIAESRLPWRRSETNEPETMTFRSDLDYKPAFNVELNNMRWFAQCSCNKSIVND